MRTNLVVTIGGVMAGLGTIPMLVTASHVAFPLWWNNCQFPLILVGMLGTILMGVAAKGQDVHSTETQIQAATAKAVVANVEAAVADPKKDATLGGTDAPKKAE